MGIQASFRGFLPISGFPRLFSTVPALPGLAFCLAGIFGSRLASPAWLAAAALWLAALVLWPRCWWLALLFSTGLGTGWMEHRKERFWEAYFSRSGFGEMRVQWTEDVYIPRKDGPDREGWADISPVSDGKIHGGLSRRFWVRLCDGGLMPPEALMAGAAFNAKTAISEGKIPFKLEFDAAGGTLPTEMSLFWRVRAACVSRMESAWKKAAEEGRPVALLRSQVTGARQGIGAEVMEGMQRLYLLHLIALSGVHVGILFVASRWLLVRVRAPQAASDLASLIVVVFFGLFGSFAASLLRAVGMCGISVLAGLLARRYVILNALAFLALAEAVFDPPVICSAAFLLSYLGVLGIIFALDIPLLKDSSTPEEGRGKRGRMRRILVFLAKNYVISWGAMLFTWPVSTCIFGVIPTWAWLFSVPIVILFSVMLPVVLLAVAASLAGLELPALFWMMLSGFQRLMEFLSAQGAWVRPVAANSPHWLWGYYAGLVGCWILMRMRAARKKT